MWLAIVIVVVLWVCGVVYACLISASNDDDRAMRDYYAEREAFEDLFE
jgi:hypothetical protein